MDPRTKAVDDVSEIFSARAEGDAAARRARAAAPSTARSARSARPAASATTAASPACPTRQRWILGGLALAGVIVAAILILPGVFDAKRDNDARVAREHAARVAAEKKRLTREQRPMRGRPAGLRAPGPTASASEGSPPAASSSLALEGAILADARSA